MKMLRILTAPAIAAAIAVAALSATPAAAKDRVNAGVVITPAGPAVAFGYTHNAPRWRAAPPAYRPGYVYYTHRWAPAYRAAPRWTRPVTARPAARRIVKTSCKPILKNRRVFMRGIGWTTTRVQVGKTCRKIWR